MLLIKHKQFHGLVLGVVEYNGVQYKSYACKDNELISKLKFQVYSKTGDRVSMMMGDSTDEPLEDKIHIRRTRNMNWFFKHLESKKQKQEELDSLPEEITYEERDGWLYIYKIKAVKQFNVSEVQK